MRKNCTGVSPLPSSVLSLSFMIECCLTFYPVIRMQEPLIQIDSFLNGTYEWFKRTSGVPQFSHTSNFLFGLNEIYEWCHSCQKQITFLHKGKTHVWLRFIFSSWSKLTWSSKINHIIMLAANLLGCVLDMSTFIVTFGPSSFYMSVIESEGSRSQGLYSRLCPVSSLCHILRFSLVSHIWEWNCLTKEELVVLDGDFRAVGSDNDQISGMCSSSYTGDIHQSETSSLCS